MSVSKKRELLGNSVLGGQHKRSFAASPQTGDVRVRRDPRFSSLEESDITAFRQILGENGVVIDADELEVANIDWMHKYRGRGQLLLRPQTSEHVCMQDSEKKLGSNLLSCARDDCVFWFYSAGIPSLEALQFQASSCCTTRW